jgi:peroxiredoxin
VPLQPGDPIPEVTLRRVTPEGPKIVAAREVLGGRRAVLFAVPGAFTSTCSDVHLPGYQARAEDLRAKGVDTIACIALNDHQVMAAWAKAHGVGDEIVFLADGNGEFTRAIGLEVDLSAFGYGTRSRRYAAIIESGVIRRLFVEQGPGVSVSGADEVLRAL